MEQKPQSLVSCSKCTWAKFQIPPQCIRSEGMISIHLSDEHVKPGGPLVLFDNSRLMSAPGFSFILLRHSHITPYVEERHSVM